MKSGAECNYEKIVHSLTLEIRTIGVLASLAVRAIADNKKDTPEQLEAAKAILEKIQDKTQLYR